MRQAIGIHEYSTCAPRRSPWSTRLRSWLGGAEREGLIPLDRQSAHLLRDIGLGDEPRANSLLRDHNLLRR